MSILVSLCLLSLAFIFNTVEAINVWPVYVGSESTLYDLNNLPVWAIHRFYPSNLTIAAGDSVVFVYKTHEQHTVTWTNNTIAASVALNGTVSPYVAPVNFASNASLTHLFDGTKNFSIGARNNLHRDSLVTFGKEGGYRLYCVLHPHMELYVTVTGANQQPKQTVEGLTIDIWNNIEQDRLRMNQYLYMMNLSFVKPLPNFAIIDQNLKQLNASSQQEGMATGVSQDGQHNNQTGSNIHGGGQNDLLYSYSRFNFTSMPANMTSFPTFGLGCNESVSRTNQTGITHTGGSVCPINADSWSSSSMSGNETATTGVNATQCHNFNVLTGVDLLLGNVSAASNRFYPSFLSIQVGDTVTFNSSYSFSPHIVIFNNTGIEPSPSIIVESGGMNEFGSKNMAFNTTFLTPIQNATFSGVGVLSSGLLLSRESTLYTTSPLRLQIPQTFTLTFNTPGIYRFQDAIQGCNGMIGWVHVKQNRNC